MLTTSAEPGVDELVDALTSQVGVRAGPVTDIAFGDHRGKVFDLDNNIDDADLHGRSVAAPLDLPLRRSRQ